MSVDKCGELGKRKYDLPGEASTWRYYSYLTDGADYVVRGRFVNAIEYWDYVDAQRILRKQEVTLTF